jgi:hypothetical protein
MSERLKGIPIGVDNFKAIISEGGYFVDKSLFIKEIIDDFASVKLITRPRRFGKTLNLSMLRYYFEKSEEKNKSLFEGLKIWQLDERYRNEQGKYPVVNITLKDVKYDNYDYCLERIKTIMATEYLRHDYIMKSDKIKEEYKQQFKAFAGQKANEVEISYSIEFLTRLLYQYHDEKVIVLIDEYDTPINHGFTRGYYEKIIDFMKVFLGSALKTNSALKMGVITGIYRVAKESIFSDMNNLYVSSVTTGAYSDRFGFTGEEVDEVLEYYGLSERKNEVRDWYNGYVFGRNTVIYNPWSIINFVKDKELQPYWVNTSSNDLIIDIIKKTDSAIKKKLTVLMEGGEIDEVVINTNINFRNITGSKVLNEEVLWNFMIVSGYLKTRNLRIEGRRTLAELKIPNTEILTLYEDMIIKWFDVEDISTNMIKMMLEHLVNGRVKEFESDFRYLVLKTFRIFDVGRNSAENFYHAFILGLLVNLDKRYRVVSNKESGDGRPDVMIIPNDTTKKGIVMEFKTVERSDDEYMEKALEEALKQIDNKNYINEFKNAGIREVIKTGIVFCGKKVIMRCQMDA